MYFKDINLIDIRNLISINHLFFAHIDKKRQEELQEHTKVSCKYFKNIVSIKKIDKVFLNFEYIFLKDCTKEEIWLFREMIIGTIVLHDIGKINPNFQFKKMNNDIGNFEFFSRIGTQHSIISSVLYIDYFLNKIKKLKSKKLIQLLMINSYVISKHHGDLDSFYTYLGKFNDDEDGCEVIKIFSKENNEIYNKDFTLSISEIRNIIKLLKSKIKNSREDSMYLYSYTKMLYSLLLASDFYATTEFMNQIEINEFGKINDINEFYSIYKDTKLYKNIRNYEANKYGKDIEFINEKNINVLRTEMFLDAENELVRNINENIFFLEAPTGSGKSNVALNLSFKLLEKDNDLQKILYIYPFNTLIEQNIVSLKNIFGENLDVFNKIAVVNSISPIKMDRIKQANNNDADYDNYEYYAKALLNRQFLNYPMILSTHVSLFNTMFDHSKESSFGFYQLANSVIVLDEIQSYKNIIWAEIISFFNTFAKLLNIKVIIMSATLPELNILSGNTDETINLILNRNKYFSNPLFKNRVNVNYDLINSDNIIEELFNHVKENSHNKKILIEFIKKQSAYDFYRKLKENLKEINCEIELITGDDNVIERKRILDKVDSEESNKNGIILVSTQVIEAGVDIDMDIGYKDISKLDSDEQFMGRINRSCKNHGMVYFFNLDEANKIYNNDIRSQSRFTLIEEEMKNILLNKNFNNYYSKILEKIKEIYNDSLSESNLEKFICDDVGNLNYLKVSKRMKLIEEDNWNMSIYLATIIKDKEGNTIDGSVVWNEYKTLLNDNYMKYAEKQVKLSEVRSKMNYFIYEIKKNDNFTYNDRIGELYFIEDGDKYFNDGKLDKEKFIKGIGDFI